MYWTESIRLNVAWEAEIRANATTAIAEKTRVREFAYAI